MGIRGNMHVDTVQATDTAAYFALWIINILMHEHDRKGNNLLVYLFQP